VPALDRLEGTRVVADPAAIDSMVGALAPSIVVLRFAPDDAFVLDPGGISVDDPHAIIEDEHGFVGGWCSIDAIRPHLEWSLPTERPALAQGSIAGVPAKLYLPEDGNDVLVVTAAAYAATLAERLGWSRP
jgi:hypothetical protein